MTEVRSTQIADVLLADLEETKKLLALSSEDAASILAKQGYDFTAEELVEFRQELEKTAELYGEDGELNEEALAAVSGGCVKCLQAGLWTIAIGVTAIGVLAPW